MSFHPRPRRLRRRTRASGASAVVSSAAGAMCETLEARKLLASVSWTNPLGGSFTDPANWSSNAVPTALDDVFITLDGDYQVTLAASSVTVNSLTLGGPVGVQTLRLDAASLTAATGITNDDSIVLTSSGGAASSTLAVTAGSLLNASGRTITTLAGAGGPRVIAAQLDNQGTVFVSGNTSLIKDGAAHSSAGAINLIGGNFTVFQSGASPSFTNTGSIAVSAGRAFTVSAGTFNQNAGSITGGGTLAVLNATANFATSFSNAATALGVLGSTINGPGTITNAAGRLLTLGNTVINAPLVNESLLLSRGSADAVNGAYTGAAGSIIRVQGNSAAPAAQLTFANGFTNNGTIDLTAADGAFGATLNVTAGTLTNAATRTITASAGTGGSRQLNTRFVNNGTIGVYAPLSVTRADAAQVNAGALNVFGGDLTVALSGASSFTNTGTVTLAAGRTFTLTGASLSNASGGTLRGGGTFAADITHAGGTVIPERPGAGSTVYYEPFGYAAGSQLHGQGGWTEPGLNDPFSSDYQKPELIQASSLSSPNLVTSGRSVQTQGLYSFDMATMPSFLGGDGNTYWISFLIRRDQNGTGGAAGPDYGGLVLGTGPGIFIGKPGGGAGVANWGLEAGNATVQSASTVPSTLGVTAFLVAKIEFHDDGIPGTSPADNDVVTLYVNPAPGTAEGSLVPAATLSMELFNFNNLGLSTGANAKWAFDEIRAGTTFADVAPRATGLLTVNGNFAATGGALEFDIAGAAVDAQRDQITVNGTVSLGGTLAINPMFTPNGAQTFTLIDNDGIDPVTGTFAGVAEGGVLFFGGRAFRISYAGGTGNDVTATYLPGLSIADISISEGTGGTKVANFTVSLSDAGAAGASVQWATSNGTATSPADYTAASGTVTFAPFVMSQQISVTIVSDALDENDETFNITLSNPTGAVISDGTAVGTITDDDPPPTITINDVSVTEGDAGTVNAVFTVSLSAASAKTVTVNASTSNGTATSPADYTAIASQLLTFSAGELTKTITVVVNADLLDELDETFSVNLSGATNATIADASGTGTITDNDPQPSLSINDIVLSEGTGGTVNATFTVSLSTVSGRSVTFNYSTANGTAMAGSDYVAAVNTPATILTGQSSVQISVSVIPDSIDEPNETFFVNLSNVSGATVTDGQGQATLNDDDLPLTVSITPVTPDPRSTAVSSIVIIFSEAVGGFGLDDLSLTRDGTAVSLAGASLGSANNVAWTLSGMSTPTGRAGSYVLTLNHDGSGIAGVGGNPITSGASDAWKMTAINGTAGNDTIRIVRNAGTSLTDVYFSDIYAYSVDVTPLSRLDLLGLDGDDTLTVDATSGVPLPISLSVMGDAVGGNGNDTVKFIGSAGFASTIRPTLISGGGVTLAHDAETLTLQTGTYTAVDDMNGDALEILGAGTTVIFQQTQHLGGLTVGAGGLVQVTAGGNKVLVTPSLNVAGLVELADNDLVFNYNGQSPIGSWDGSGYTGVEGMIAAGRGDGSWNGSTGLTSSAAASGYTGLGVAEASDVLDYMGGGTALFAGETVDATAVLVKFTYVGDMTLDGRISGDDYSSIDFHVGMAGASGYHNGDLNYDGLISGDDYSAIDFNLVQQGPML